MEIKKRIKYIFFIIVVVEMLLFKEYSKFKNCKWLSLRVKRSNLLELCKKVGKQKSKNGVYLPFCTHILSHQSNRLLHWVRNDRVHIIFESTFANLSKSSSKCKALTTSRVTGKSVEVGYGKHAVIIPLSFKNSCTPI
jgi:hypothetical protein